MHEGAQFSSCWNANPILISHFLGFLFACFDMCFGTPGIQCFGILPLTMKMAFSYFVQVRSILSFAYNLGFCLLRS